LAAGFPGAAVPLRPGRVSRADLGVANSDEFGYWLRSVNRNPCGKGTVPNRAATQHAGLRRRRGHVVCGVGFGRGRSSDRARGGGPTLTTARRSQLPADWDRELCDEKEGGTV